MKTISQTLIILLLLLSTSCAEDNFSQYLGFDAIRDGLGDTIPASAQQQLIKQYQPILFIADTEEGPIDFYADYIANGTLTESGGAPLSNVTSADLNRARHDPQAVFEHNPSSRTPITPTAYGGIYQATLTLSDGKTVALTFLSYYFVFRHSGLPRNISPIYRRLAGLFGDINDWHQLDHYTAAFVALNDNQPFAVILQQHNYMRTYFIEDEAAFAMGKIMIDAAISSNELYPHRKNEIYHRAAGSMNAKTVDYLTGQSDHKGWRVADDVTHGAREVDYQLKFLPPNDAFYVFEGYLGKRRILPGRDGPPGAIYRNVPEWWPLEKSLYVFYWHDNDSDYARWLKTDGIRQTDNYLRRFSQRFYKIQ